MKYPVIRVREFQRTTIGIVVAVVLIGACSHLFSDLAARKPALNTIPPLNVTVASKVIHRDDVWQESKRIAPGTWMFDAGTVPADGALRIGFSAQSINESESKVTVYCDKTLVETVVPDSSQSWTDKRIGLAPYAGKECRVVFETKTPLLLSACEILPATTRRPNVLVYLIDTLRFDHLGCYGYARDTSPTIDTLAAEGYVFTETISQASWTRPAVASLLTSLYPSAHGALDRADVLPDTLESLPRVLSRRGYDTAAFVANPSCLPMWGFGKGFRRFEDIESSVVSGSKDAAVADSVIEALQLSRGKPWFYYVHNIGPHSPYDPPEPYRHRFVTSEKCLRNKDPEMARLIDLYDGAIAFTDAQLGRIIQTLKDNGEYDNTIIVVLADHGETLGERGDWGHGSSLYDEQIRIPLIIKPARAHEVNMRCEGTTEIVDVAPTILDLLTIPAPTQFQGTSLRGMLAGKPAPQRAAYASLYLEKHDLRTARDAGMKYTYDGNAKTETWFDLTADPGEAHGLTAAPEQGAQLAQYATRMSVSRREGLHIMVTGALDQPRTIAGTLTGPGLGKFDLRYAARNGNAELTDDGLSFRINTGRGPNTPTDLATWIDTVGEVNNAELVIHVDPHTPVFAAFTLDNGPIPPNLLRLGPNKVNGESATTELKVSDLAANSDLFNPTRLPSELAIYVWYVPPVESIGDNSLEPEYVEAMKTLGYMQ